MTRFLRWALSRAATRGEYTVVHVVTVSMIISAAFMVYSAGAWGAMAALAIAVAWYVAVVALCIELVLLARRAVRRLARALLSRIGAGALAGTAGDGGVYR